jgi:glutathione synthase/RimK-type ligase-like ATP-grasp enzyme
MTPVVLATCAELPGGDEDADLLNAALRRRGLTPRWQVWDAPETEWDDALVVVRSTWDYTNSLDRFRAWASAVRHLANPAEVIAWNTDKTYLLELASTGVPIVPTAVARPGETAQFPDGVEFVVKPSVGAGSRGAGRFAAGDLAAARTHVAELHARGRTALIQPYLGDVDEHGETALIYVAGVFSHAIAKGAMLPAGVVHPHTSGPLFVKENITERTPSAAEMAVGTHVLSALRERYGYDLLYVRVDLLPSPDGPVLVELELTEPSLFLGYGQGAADRFAAAIAAEAARR